MFNAKYAGRGILVRIENSSFLTEHNAGDIKIPAGFHTNMRVERSFKSIMPRPYSNCEIDNDSPRTMNSDLYNLIAASPYEYTQQICFLQCYQKLTIQYCNCSDSSLSLYDAAYCTSDDELACVDTVFYRKFLVNNYIQEVCKPLCPLECNKTEYRASLTSYRLIGDLYAKFIQENANLSVDFLSGRISASDALESMVSVNIFYDTLSFTMSKESAKVDVITLLATIGGNLGLFLGVSVFSLCELFEVFIEIYYRYNERKAKKMIDELQKNIKT